MSLLQLQGCGFCLKQLSNQEMRHLKCFKQTDTVNTIFNYFCSRHPSLWHNSPRLWKTASLTKHILYDSINHQLSLLFDARQTQWTLNHQFVDNFSLLWLSCFLYPQLRAVHIPNHQHVTHLSHPVGLMSLHQHQYNRGFRYYPFDLAFSQMYSQYFSVN